MRDITPKPSQPSPAQKPAGKPDIEAPPPAFTYDPLSPKQSLPAGSIGNDQVPLPPHSKKSGSRNMRMRSVRNSNGKQSDKEPGRLKAWWKWLKWPLLIIFIGAIAAFVFLSFQVTKITSNPFSWGKLKGEREGRINILLLGVGDPGHAGEGLADTNMVVSLNTKDGKVAMISIPRDTRVKIPGYGYQKINNAHAQGDIPLATKTVEQTLGVPIHYYVRANFSGLKQAVDAVGGIDITVTERLYDPEYPCDKNEYRSCGFKLNPGPTHMDGSLALKYARCRKGNCGDDFGRALRQQEVLKAVRVKAASMATLSNPAKLNALLGSAANNIKTDLSINNIMRLNELSKKFDTTNVINATFSLQPNGFLKSDPGGTTDLLPVGGSFSAIQEFVANIFTVGPVWAEQPTVVIENGTSTIGVAKKLSDTISTGKYGDLIATSMTNALKRDYTTSQIIDYTNGKKPATATYLKSLVGVTPAPPTALPTGKLPAGPADFVVILGSDYIAKTSTSTTTKP